MHDLYRHVRPLLFRLDPERAHSVGMGALQMAERLGLTRKLFSESGSPVRSPTRVMGIDFPNPIGLAAGLDKNAHCPEAFAGMGFGFVEVGTVTPRPQPGNPRPRMFRVEQHQAIINRLGFNNDGVDALVQRVARLKSRSFVLGINLGRNKSTPNESAVDDYLLGLEAVHGLADYITINISSPNTANLRDLQTAQGLHDLMEPLIARREALESAAQSHRRTPFVVKIAPDLSSEEISSIATACNELKLDGVIATNTTIDRQAIAGHHHADQAGGLSGAPLTGRANDVLAQLKKELDPGVALIAAGGVMTPDDVIARLESGADLVQIYTGLIYSGPRLVADSVAAAQRWFASG